MKPVLDIKSSVLEQAWHWRGGGTDGRDPDFQPDDLVTQLLMARGVDRDDIERHRNPTIRNFMPDPSIFQDMEHAALRLAQAVEAESVDLALELLVIRARALSSRLLRRAEVHLE